MEDQRTFRDLAGQRLTPRWELDVEQRPASRCIIEGNLPAEPRDDLFHNAQAQAGSTLLTRVRSVVLRKLSDDMGLEVVRNARTMVAHRNADRSASSLNRHGHLVALR